jgi:hypothetical protein
METMIASWEETNMPDGNGWAKKRAKLVKEMRAVTKKAQTPEGRAAAAKLLSELPAIDNQRTTAHMVPDVKSHPSPEEKG